MKREGELDDTDFNLATVRDLVHRLVPAAPEESQKRPGAPTFRLGLASTRSDPPWLFSATVYQFDGTDIGDFKARWYGSAVEPRDLQSVDPTGPVSGGSQTLP